MINNSKINKIKYFDVNEKKIYNRYLTAKNMMINVMTMPPYRTYLSDWLRLSIILMRLVESPRAFPTFNIFVLIAFKAELCSLRLDKVSSPCAIILSNSMIMKSNFKKIEKKIKFFINISLNLWNPHITRIFQSPC